MIDIVGVIFEDNGKVYYFTFNNIDINKNTTVIVDSEYGPRFGKIATKTLAVQPNNTIYYSIIRKATKKDYLKHKQNLNDSIEALKTSRRLVKQNNLNINILDAEFNFDRSQLRFNFTSDKRVDFRKLVRDLASIYKTRIELRQIGVRDKSAKVGGLGQCGRKLCCSYFLNELDTVTINMAKNQNLSLNPSKINGVCGRLLCCLKYENENYSECRKCFPKVGSIVQTDKGKGVVKELNILNNTYKVYVKNVGLVEKVVNKNGSCQ